MATTTLYLRDVDEALAREAKALAAREGITLTALVERALAHETQRARQPRAGLSEIAEDMAWYESNKSALLERFEGQHLAVVGQEVVDHDPDLEALAARVAERYGSRSVYMPLCELSPQPVQMRSPRIA